MSIEITEIKPDRQLMTSHTIWEFDFPVAADDVSPDLIADAVRESLDDLIGQSFLRMVALDWSTTTIKIVGRDIDTLVVTQVNVLR